MIYPEDQLEELKAQFGPDVREFEEGGHIYLYIPGLKMPPGCTPEKTDALLCPQPHSGYTSRLFFKDQIQTPKSVNWNGQVFVLGHLWHAFSYNNVKDMPLLNMLMSHLRGMVDREVRAKAKEQGCKVYQFRAIPEGPDDPDDPDEVEADRFMTEKMREIAKEHP